MSFLLVFLDLLLLSLLFLHLAVRRVVHQDIGRAVESILRQKVLDLSFFSPHTILFNVELDIFINDLIYEGGAETTQIYLLSFLNFFFASDLVNIFDNDLVTAL